MSLTSKSILFLCMIGMSPLPAAAQEDFEPRKPKQTVGWIEKVRLSPGDLLLHARLNPGTAASTLYAENVKKMRKNKRLWVSWEVTDRYGNGAKLSREVIRSLKVKNAEGKTIEEHVVSLGMCLGRKYFEDEVRLIGKKREEYDLRLGRQALEGNFVIDPGAKLTTDPDCGERGKDLGPVETVAPTDQGSAEE